MSHSQWAHLCIGGTGNKDGQWCQCSCGLHSPSTLFCLEHKFPCRSQYWSFPHCLLHGGFLDVTDGYRRYQHGKRWKHKAIKAIYYAWVYFPIKSSHWSLLYFNDSWYFPVFKMYLEFLNLGDSKWLLVEFGIRNQVTVNVGNCSWKQTHQCHVSKQKNQIQDAWYIALFTLHLNFWRPWF